MDIINFSPEPGEYEDDFISHVCNNLKDEYKELFVTNHLRYLKYKNTPDAFVINIEDIWNWIGFTRKDNAVRLLKNKYVLNEDYIEENIVPQNELVLDDYNSFLPKEERFLDKQNGGQNKITIMMSINTFKNFCMIVSTSTGKKFRRYYIHIENLNDTYIDKKRIEYNNNLRIQYEINMEKQRHELLIDKYDNTRLVYVMKIFDIDNKSYIIKIGSSIGIGQRCKQINSQYKVSIKVLEVYPCELFKEFESTLHHHSNILKFKYKEKINDIRPNEFYKISDKRDYDSIIKTIKEELPKFKSSNKKILALELRNKMKEKDLLISENYRSTAKDNLALAETILKLSDKLTGDQLFESIKLLFPTHQKIVTKEFKNQESLTEFYSPQNFTLINQIKLQSSQNENEVVDPLEDENIVVKQDEPDIELSPEPATNGPRVQVYDKDDITKLLHVFEGITEATRHIPNSNMSQIKKAVSGDKLHAGYRWHFVNRDDPTYAESKVIPPTRYSGQKRDYENLALLNLRKTEIIKVFNKQKEVADYLEQSNASVCLALKYGNIIGLEYYCFKLKDVDEELVNKYLEENQIPEDVRLNTKKVERIDQNTKEVLETLNSITDVQKKYTISPKVLESCTKTGKPYKGFIWRIIK